MAMKNVWLFIIALAGVCCFVLPAGPAWTKEANSIDELLSMFDESNCMECHTEIHQEWENSWHSKSVVSSLPGMHNFIEIGLKKEWNKPLDKQQVLKCLDCHAPVVNFASEKLAVEIGNMIVTAHKKKDTPEGQSARKELEKLNVGCLSCHNIKATEVARGFNGPAEKGMIYGPHGEDAGDAHETMEAVDITRSSFCMQCHGIYTSSDGETVNCNTLSGSYQDNYISQGGSQTCQGCHLKKGHMFPGGHDLETVQAGLGLNVQVSPYTHLPGQIPDVKDQKKWVPSAVVTVFIENRTGHRVPDG